jgi:hypothetical protein
MDINNDCLREIIGQLGHRYLPIARLVCHKWNEIVGTPEEETDIIKLMKNNEPVEYISWVITPKSNIPVDICLYAEKYDYLEILDHFWTRGYEWPTKSLCGTGESSPTLANKQIYNYFRNHHYDNDYWSQKAPYIPTKYDIYAAERNLIPSAWLSLYDMQYELKYINRIPVMPRISDGSVIGLVRSV